MSNDQINTDLIRQKVQDLVHKLGTSKTKLGAVLAGNTTSKSQVNINRANRFLNGEQKSISIEQLMALAKFFDKELDWFLQEESSPAPHQLSSPDHSYHHHKPLEEIRKNLQQMGFDQDFIEHEITNLKAMEAYNIHHKQQNQE